MKTAAFKNVIRQNWLPAVGAFHLFLVALFAAHFSVWGPDWKLNHGLHNLGDFTGSNSMYTFFAPRVGEQTCVIYSVVDSSGSQRVIRLPVANRETTNRLNTIYNFLAMDEAKNVLPRSLVETVFRQNPTAKIIRVQVVKQKMPTLAEFKNGLPIKWESLYFQDFARAENPSKSI